MGQFFRRSVAAFIDNIFDVLTACVAAYAFIRNLATPYTTNDLPTLIGLAVSCLGLLAVSGVWVRQRELGALKRQSETVQHLVEGLASGKARADQFLSDGPMLAADEMAKARDIYIVGMTLGRTSRELVHPLGECVQRGASCFASGPPPRQARTR